MNYISPDLQLSFILILHLHDHVKECVRIHAYLFEFWRARIQWKIPEVGDGILLVSSYYIHTRLHT